MNHHRHLRREPPSTEAMQRAVDAWNAANTIGTVVTFMRDNGQAEIRRTTSAAYMLSGHTAVIHMAGVSGCWMLDRVSRCADQTLVPVNEQAAGNARVPA
jgi:hypothetical protein